MRARLILCLLIAQFFSLAAAPVNSIDFINPSAIYQFGSRLVFQVEITPQVRITEAYVFYQPSGHATIVEQAKVEGGHISFFHDLERNPLRPFARMEYHFQVKLLNGEDLISPSYYFVYEDNRFKWQTLEQSGFLAHWQEGDLDFGQSILNTLDAAVKNSRGILPIEIATPINVYVYPDPAELQTALTLSQSSWVAGHASPDLGVILLSIPTGPDQRLELERQIPHELMHVQLFQLAGDAYPDLPIWFTEGLASFAELYPDPDYQRVIDRAIQQDSLLPVGSLCQAFPEDSSGRFLGYAQSESFVRFLHTKYGTTGLLSLIEQYRNGLGCAEGVQAAFGQPLSTMETQWREEALGINQSQVAFRNLLPYILLFAVLLVVPAVLSFASRKFNQPSAQQARRR